MVDKLKETVNNLKIPELVMGLIGLFIVVATTSIGGTWALVNSATKSINKNIDVYLKVQTDINKNLADGIKQNQFEMKNHLHIDGHRVMVERVKALMEEIKKQEEIINNIKKIR